MKKKIKVSVQAWRNEKSQFLMYVKSTLGFDRGKISDDELANRLWRDYNSRVRASFGNGYRVGFIAGVKEGARK